MTDTLFKTQTRAAAPGSTSAFLDTLQRQSSAKGAAARSPALIRQVTDDHERPALTIATLIAAVIVLSVAISWAIAHFHFG